MFNRISQGAVVDRLNHYSTFHCPCIDCLVANPINVPTSGQMAR
jgi:hypothetical protein